MLGYLKKLWYILLSLLMYKPIEEESKRNKCTKRTKRAPYGRRLNCSEVMDIIREYKYSNISNKELAKKYGVSKSTISRIVNKKSYKHCH